MVRMDERQGFARPAAGYAMKPEPEVLVDERAVTEATVRLGIELMTTTALIEFLAGCRSTDPAGAEAAMRELEFRGASPGSHRGPPAS